MLMMPCTNAICLTSKPHWQHQQLHFARQALLRATQAACASLEPPMVGQQSTLYWS